MQKLTENLIEGYLIKPMMEICFNVVEEHFDACFENACSYPNENDTTIGQTCRSLEKIADKIARDKFDTLIEEVSSEMAIVSCSPSSNPFSKIACHLWESFLERYTIRGFAEGLIYDECVEKFDSLIAEGILNSEGDYVRK